MSAAMQYSKPPLMLSGSSPFQNPGAGKVGRDRELTVVGQLDVAELALVDRDVAVSEVATAAPAGVAAAAAAVVAARGDCEHERERQNTCSELAHLRTPGGLGTRGA